MRGATAYEGQEEQKKKEIENTNPKAQFKSRDLNKKDKISSLNPWRE